MKFYRFHMISGDNNHQFPRSFEQSSEKTNGPPMVFPYAELLRPNSLRRHEETTRSWKKGEPSDRREFEKRE